MSPNEFRLTIVESPYAASPQYSVDDNVAYARRCIADCFKRGEAGLASHLIYTQPGILDDTKPEERKLGIAAGFAWGQVADVVVFYIDHDWSRGMLDGVKSAIRNDACIEVRALDRETTPDDIKPIHAAYAEMSGAS